MIKLQEKQILLMLVFILVISKKTSPPHWINLKLILDILKCISHKMFINIYKYKYRYINHISER